MSVVPTGPGRLTTVSLRTRITAAVLIVLTIMLALLAVAVIAIFTVQSNRNLDALLTGRVQLARQLARSGVGPQQIVNRVSADGVQAYLVLRNGTSFGIEPGSGAAVRSVSTPLPGTGRVAGSQLTLSVDTSLAAGGRRTLRRVLFLTALGVLGLSALLVTVAVRLALRPLEVMAGLARTIARGDRGHRLAPLRTDTELGQTAAAFDEMLDELEGAESRARAAEERTRTFLADAAHELRTPIAGVQAAAETLLHHGTGLDPADREHLEVLLIREARRAGLLIADLLAAARLDAGVDLDRRPTSLRSLAHAELERVRLLAPAAAVTLSGPEVVLPADPARIAGILRNLTDNALRAAGPQGRLHLQLGSTGTAAYLDVWDSGPGVPAADRERIFERLVRLDQDRATDTGGSGLGLAIARGYARAHGGDLVCLDPRGPGALFRLTVPLEPPTPRTVP